MTPVELVTHMPAVYDMNVLDGNKHFLVTFSPATSSWIRKSGNVENGKLERSALSAQSI